MKMDTIVLLGITLFAGFFLWKRFFSGKGGCNCGSDCSSCGDDKNARVYGLKKKKSSSAVDPE